ncbi:hypothetical protein [Niabella beijingensis]|uniref:hypothetical protein n=1 Tax=Niabella beijingensis TaxID=2872700 RepID=UPI001CBCD161|nr:hypothetical protein [Niabella beijingensis]MBZ4187369.1 hypothetical protein [Niabella beijingensis]
MPAEQQLYKYRQPWLQNKGTDLFFILSPPFVCLLLIISFPHLFRNDDRMSLTGWILLVLLIDVGHVYTTLYRTYFDRNALKTKGTILWVIPFVAFTAGLLLYNFSALWFWRVLAYAAVYHFIRQQYGFMRLYSRFENKRSFTAKLDTAVIYSATLYPLFYWHISGPRNFNWFITGDFVYFGGSALLPILGGLYFILLLVYIFHLTIQTIKTRHFNLPKFGIIAGTVISWYFGIVYFNGDMAFTLLNVVSHGVPYMALVWVHGRKVYSKQKKENPFLHRVFSKKGILIFLFIIFGLAFMEEFFWDIAVWKEHRVAFGGSYFAAFQPSGEILNILVPLLALPQFTHYILDGFIWKIRKNEIKWSSEINK